MTSLILGAESSALAAMIGTARTLAAQAVRFITRHFSVVRVFGATDLRTRFSTSLRRA
jgi:hypothetical protein